MPSALILPHLSRAVNIGLQGVLLEWWKGESVTEHSLPGTLSCTIYRRNRDLNFLDAGEGLRGGSLLLFLTLMYPTLRLMLRVPRISAHCEDPDSEWQTSLSKEQPHLSKSYSPPVLFWPLQRQQETGQFSVVWQTLAPVVLQLFLALPTWTAFPCVVNGCATVHVDKISP